MREGGPTVHVAERPNPRNICLQPGIDSDKAQFVGLDSRHVQTEIFRVWPAPDGGEQVRSGNCQWSTRCGDRNPDRALGMLRPSGMNIQMELNALPFENFLKFGGDLRILARNDLRLIVKDGNP